VINTSTRVVIATVPVGTAPWGIAVAPGGTKVYVATTGAVWIISTATDTVSGTFPVVSPGGANRDIAFTPDGSELWVGGGCTNCIKVFAFPSNADVGTITGVIGNAERLKFLPDGSFAFANNGCGCCGNLQKISTTSKSVVSTLFFSGAGAGLGIAPDGSAVYAGTQGHCGGGGNQVKRINPSSNTVTGSLPVGGPPEGFAITPDGSPLYCALENTAGQVLAVDTSNLTVAATSAVGNAPCDVVIAPTLKVVIDIKPGEDPPSINPGRQGTIPVAILSSSTFDATAQADRTSLTFGRTGNEHSLAFCNSTGEDVNGDGLLDLVCHFDTPKTGFQAGDTLGVLKGKTVNNIPIQGSDSVRIVR